MAGRERGVGYADKREHINTYYKRGVSIKANGENLPRTEELDYLKTLHLRLKRKRNSNELESSEAGPRPASCRSAVPTEDLLGTEHHTESPRNPLLPVAFCVPFTCGTPGGGWAGVRARGGRVDSWSEMVFKATVSLMFLLPPDLCPSPHHTRHSQFLERNKTSSSVLWGLHQ